MDLDGRDGSQDAQVVHHEKPVGLLDPVPMRVATSHPEKSKDETLLSTFCKKIHFSTGLCSSFWQCERQSSSRFFAVMSDFKQNLLKQSLNISCEIFGFDVMK